MLPFLGGLGNLKGSEFLLDSYITLGEPMKLTLNGCDYYLQYYQGDNADEYMLKKDNKVCLFQMEYSKCATKKMTMDP